MAKSIKAPVGKGKKNNSDDVELVQDLLNAFTKLAGTKKLKTDGAIGPKTLEAIGKFQKNVCGFKPDFVISPGKTTIKTLAAGPKKAEAAAKKEEAAATGGGGGTGKVTGKTQGVSKKLISVMEEVSAHYGKPIHVVSGLRSRPHQAACMYNGWKSHLKRGKVYTYLKKNDKFRVELDQLVIEGNKKKFVETMLKKADWGKVSKHLTGQAADVTLKTDPKIIAALATCLKYLPEGNSEGIKCHHFDTRKCLYPIKDTIKAKWKM